MTVKELAQKIKDSDYTCQGINCRECISVNGFGCCLQADKKLFVSMFLLSQNKEYAELLNEINELKEQIEKISEELQAIKTSYDNSKDKTPINVMGAEYRLFCDIENLIEKLEAREK